MEDNTSELFLYKEGMLEIGQLTRRGIKNLGSVEAHRLVQLTRETSELRKILDGKIGIHGEE